MSILDAVLNKSFGPVFVKENTESEIFLKKMKTLSAQADSKLKAKIEKQITAVEHGFYGEKQVAYELKNSRMDMLIAHDLFLEKNGLTAQIDFLVITRKHIFVIECKNLYGNIEIDDKGNFIRHKGNGRFYRKEGFPSPVSQNERHLNLLKEIRKDSKKNFLTKILFEKYCSNFYRSIVVLANSKTVLNDKNAPKEVRNIVIRSDQLISYIKRIEASDDNDKRSETEMYELMDSFLKYSSSNKSDYAKKYEALLVEQESEKSTEKKQNNEKYKPFELQLPIQNSLGLDEKGEKKSSEKVCPRCGSLLVLRIAKKGENVGKNFYGCSAFPKCRYIDVNT